MILDINVQLDYEMITPTDLILQIEAQTCADQAGIGQRVVSEALDFGDIENTSRVTGEGGIGQRVLIPMERNFACTYRARIEINRPALDIATLSATQRDQLPSEAVRGLMPSRYCHSDLWLDFVSAQFGGTQGGQRIAAIADWIAREFKYVSGSSSSQTTGCDTIAKRQGICRDFAHVLITLARASGIPARFASVYAPLVTPQDFHAVAEVFLEGAWHLIDTTGMTTPDQTARIGVGMDAAEVPFLSSYDPIRFKAQSVRVDEVL